MTMVVVCTVVIVTVFVDGVVYCVFNAFYSSTLLNFKKWKSQMLVKVWSTTKITKHYCIVNKVKWKAIYLFIISTQDKKWKRRKRWKMIKYTRPNTCFKKTCFETSGVPTVIPFVCFMKSEKINLEK